MFSKYYSFPNAEVGQILWSANSAQISAILALKVVFIAERAEADAEYAEKKENDFVIISYDILDLTVFEENYLCSKTELKRR